MTELAQPVDQYSGPGLIANIAWQIHDDQGLLKTYDEALADATNSPTWDPSLNSQIFQPYDQSANGTSRQQRAESEFATNVMWVDYDGEHVLTSSPVGGRKGRAWRLNPLAAVSVVDRENPWRWVEVSGRVTDIHPDEGLAFINKLSQRYTGGPYSRTGEREVFVITPDRVRSAAGRR